MNSFFISGECSDRAYRNVRDADSEPLLEARTFTEQLWRKYATLADPHFRQEARAHFLERFWEMYLGVTLLEKGFKILPSQGAGPEFSFIKDGRRYWVEAVVPGPGTGDDRVQETQPGVVSTVPTDKILLRFANAVAAKRERYEAALLSGIIAPGEGYLLAINSRGIPDGADGNTLPFYIQALLPFGDLTLRLDSKTGAELGRFYQDRKQVLKENNAPVSTQPFLESKFACISAVVHSGVDCVNRPRCMGADFSVLHNPLANVRLNATAFAWCDQYSYRDGELNKELANTSLQPSNGADG